MKFSFMNLITTLLISLCLTAALLAMGFTSSWVYIIVGAFAGILSPFKTFTPEKPNEKE